MGKRKCRLNALKYREKIKCKDVKTMGFPPYNVVELKNGFSYHHSGLIPSYGVRVVRR